MSFPNRYSSVHQTLRTTGYNIATPPLKKGQGKFVGPLTIQPPISRFVEIWYSGVYVFLEAAKWLTSAYAVKSKMADNPQIGNG